MANPDGAKPRKEEGNMAMTLSSVGIRNDQEYSSDAEGQNYDENAMLAATNDKKKSCFQITSVKASETGQNDDIDSNDDMDESRAEDFSSSELLDVSKASTQTDLDRLDLGENSHSTPIKKVTPNNFPPSNSSIVNLGNQAIPSKGDQKRRTGNEPPHELKHQLSDSGKQTTNGTHKASNGNPASRFKVVKVPRIEPFTRGRWRCRDFEAQAPTTQSSDVNRTEQNKDLQHSGDSSAASSVHYVPGENNPADNPFGGDTSEQYGNMNSIVSTRLGVYKTKMNNDKHRNISPMDHQQGSLEHHIKETLNIDHSSGPTEDTALSSEDGDGLGANVPLPLRPLSPYRYARLYGRRTSAGGAIDNKIEQAMDLVKSHLLYAVREEVEVLKVQIKELADKNEQLQRENAMLRGNHNAPQGNTLAQANQPQGAPMGIQQQTLPQQQPTTHPHQQQYTTAGGAQGQTQQGQTLPPLQGQLQGNAPHPQGIPQQQPPAQLSMSVPTQQQPQHLQQTSQSIPMQQHSIPGAQQTGALQHAPSQQAVQHSQPPPKS